MNPCTCPYLSLVTCLILATPTVILKMREKLEGCMWHTYQDKVDVSARMLLDWVEGKT